MVTMGAFRALEEADVILVPVSSEDGKSVAGDIYSRLGGRKETHPLWFPMTGNAVKRDAEILRQISGYERLWRNARSVALPVIGDSALYATAAYLYFVWRGVSPGLELKLLPGISAHSLASCAAGEFMALGGERLAILPGSAEASKLGETMRASDCVALYKPSALGLALPGLVEATGPWGKAVRVHRAGLPGQYSVSGRDASEPTEDYLSVLLLWRNR
jgi:precorrin-2/cobalt-factor-2 C20-methyltransferase